MLVMARKDKEGVQIGDDIFVYVVKDKNGCLKVGIDAPKHINIRRLEVEDNRLAQFNT